MKLDALGGHGSRGYGKVEIKYKGIKAMTIDYLKGATHFGDTGIDLESVSEWVNSDTFFSALMNACNAVNGAEAASALIQTFKERPPFIISSLFLY